MEKVSLEKYLTERNLNNTLLALCIVILALKLLNMDFYRMLLALKLSMIMVISAIFFLFGRDAQRYCNIVSIPSVFVVFLFKEFRNQYTNPIELAILFIILLFFLYSSFNISFFSSRASSLLFYLATPIGPAMIFLSKSGMSLSIFSQIFFLILCVILFVSSLLYYYESSYWKIKRGFSSFGLTMYHSNDELYLEIGEIICFFSFQIALVLYHFDLLLFVPTIFLILIIFAVNNHLRFSIGINMNSFKRYLSITSALLIAGLITFYWLNIHYISITCVLASISLIFLLVSYSFLNLRDSGTEYDTSYARLSDLNFLYVPVFLSISFYYFEYGHTPAIITNSSEEFLGMILQSTVTSLIAIEGMGVTVYISVVVLLIKKSKEVYNGSSLRTIFAASLIIISFSLRCLRLLNCAIDQFADINANGVFYLAYQTNYTLVVLIMTILSIIFFAYKDQKIYK